MMDENDSPDTLFQPQTLVDLLRTRARQMPVQQAYLYLIDGEEEGASLTFSELDQRARSIGAWLQQEGFAGERVLLLYPPGLDFITAFFGCLYAGVVAVPVYPPRLNRPSARIQSIVADAQVTAALTTTKIYEGLARRFDMMPELVALRWLNSEEMPADLPARWQDPGITGDNLAFLQYTSGSTGSPKGVMLSHGNLIQNLEIIRHGFQIGDKPTGAFWLPNYHDMGLIGGILEPMFVGGRSVLMAPAAFLQKPVRWLDVISRYRANISGAPNFAYQMCIDKITSEQREGLDLSCWSIAFCGAEPIRLETLDNFANTFAAQGFRRESFYPCYGLAESTLMVSGGDGAAVPKANRFQNAALSQNRGTLAAAEEDSTVLVGCGHALLDQQIVIVNPNSLTACAPGEIGEIWTAGASVAQGYWQRAALTEEIFHAYLPGSKKGPFLRTGDLGFLYEGELYVTGRLKDMIIIRGRNHYPQDIEHTVGQCHEALEAGRSAAFSVLEEGEEKLVLVHEVTRRHRKPDLDSVVKAVRSAVAQEHEIQVHGIALIRPLSIPRTSSGKIQRHVCKRDYLDGTLRTVGLWQASQGPAADAINRHADLQSMDLSAAAVTLWLVEQISAKLGIPAAQVDVRTPFVEYGLDSVKAVSIAGEIETKLGRSLAPTVLWDYPSIEALSAYLARESQERVVEDGQDQLAEHAQNESSADIAVVGLSCRFPGAASPEEFWRLLQQGSDAVQEVPPERWDLDLYYGEGDTAPRGKMNTRWGGFLAQVDKFDAAFFGISPREAARLDPQQRLLLEVSWEALERAGQNPAALAGSATGVFIGISSSDYSHLQFSDRDLIDAYAGTGNAHSVAANRLSYFLDLQGPSMAIDTACSSSLVATHLGMNSLRSGEVDLALAGGVNVLLSPDLTITFSQAQMMATDGRCKTFDARADGYVRGEGCGIVVLKRLSDAQRDGDQILAVLHGSAVNQDGRSNGLTAPNGLAQQAVIRQAMASAAVTPADISYIEAHGTGTRLGDPIEIHALQAVLDDGQAQNPVVIGSVKTNIGHLEAAAGAAGLIKTILALSHEQIPAHLHFQKLNPHITLDKSRLAIGGAGHSWQRGKNPRLAGVSSFGFGGTNAHVIVGEAAREEEAVKREEGEAHLLTLSAKDENALRQMAGQYAAALAENPALTLADICYTANTGRAQFDHRLAFVAETTSELQKALSTHSLPHSLLRPPLAIRRSPLKVAYLFTGQGSQYAGMGQQLYETQPLFRSVLERCAAILDQELERPLLEIIYGQNGAAEIGQPDIDETSYTQPTLFAVEYALAELWRSWGVEPDIVMGHSVGEFVAACVAGVMSLEDGLRLIAARGRLMGALPAGGGMAAIFAPEDRVRAALAGYGGQVWIAGINGPRNTAVSGEEGAVTAVVEQLAEEGVEYRYLTVSHAFHSHLMDPILDAFTAEASKISFQAPRIPLISNVSGKLMKGAPDAEYWREHARRAVQFLGGMHSLIEQGPMVFLEIGPQPHLTGMGKRCLAEFIGTDAGPIWLYSLKKGRDDWRLMLESLGSLVMAGADIDWASFYGAHGEQKVILPTYPFQRERHWLETKAATSGWQTAGDNWPAAIGEGVRRLRTAVPLFEAKLVLPDEERNEAILREMLFSVARLFWGAGEHMVQGLALGERFSTVRGELITQTTLNVTGEDTAFFQVFSYDDENGSWKMLGGGQLRRGEEKAVVSEHTQVTGVTRQVLLDAAPEARPELVQDYLQERAADVLDLPAARLDLEQPLDNVGMDSLMALELKNRIELDLKADLPLVDLLQGPTIKALALTLLNYLTRPAATAVIQPLTTLGEAAPLTYDQQAMWLLHQLLPPDTSFNVAGAARLVGDLDVPALRHALQLLVERHVSLRTTFKVEKGQPVQIVQDTVMSVLREIEASGWDETALQSFMEKEAQRPFKLEEGPLLRLLFLRRGAQEAVLLLSINHLIADFWSMSLLVQELYLLYTAERTGIPASLPSIELLPSDYAHWQAQMLASPEGEVLREYWLEKLAGELPRLDLPTDRPRPSVLSFDGDAARHIISKDITARLKAISQEQGTTLATTLLAAFQTLLHRMTRQDDLLVGSVIAGRDRPELQNMVGYFVNPVALRADFSGSPTFVEFLAQMRQTMFEAIDHQEYPLPRLAEDLAASGRQHLDPSRPPLFETMFIMQRAQVMAEQGLSAFALGMPGTRLELGGSDSRTALTIEPMPLGRQPAQFDLTLMMAEVDDKLAAALHYNKQLFDRETAEQLLMRLEILLAGITETAGKAPLSSLPVLVDDEREKLLVSWNNSGMWYEKEITLHEMVSRQARQTPEAIAVTFEGSHLTYGELEIRANQLAYYLQDLGVGSETLVGLFVERSLDMITGLLGILKAGGAYIPLDPNFPPSRIRLMLEDAQPTVLLTQEHLLDASGWQGSHGSGKLPSTATVCLDSQWPVVEKAAARKLPAAGQHDLAYVIYTSGSTGRPKGVQIPHKAAVNFLQSMQHIPGMASMDHLLAVTTLSFDIALLELFLPLISGARVTIASRETAVDGVALQQLLDSAGITVMQATPATWRLLLEAGWRGKDDLKILCGGEALPADLAEQLLARCASLWNMYGPTETTVWSTICPIVKETEIISIGRPIANTQIYILDQQMQPVPTGVVGDLYIAGDGLARGYLNRPQLTAERFLPNPFAGGGASMYKTGDLARYLPDGNILFLGRDDFQVKIRGYRIELGDIEAAVAQHPAVAQNVCIAHEESSGERRLASYIVPRAGETLPAAAELGAFMRAHLPDYMIPAQFIVLEALPLMPNGKINRGVLPEPDGRTLLAGGDYVPPRTDLEAQVAELCASILNLDKISIHDSFFDLGGNSLLATRLIFQTREQFKVNIPLRQLFTQPTVAGLSQSIEAARQHGHSGQDDGRLREQQPFFDKMTLAKLQAEVQLDPAIHADGLPAARTIDPQHVLLTGATGFVGAFLLRDLLHDTQAIVHCLVRAADEQAGLDRLQKNMATYGLWDETFSARITAVPGKLDQQRFGLSAAQFQDLARQIDMIIHNGALVNFIYSYQEHKAANVAGTEEILRLASQEKVKAVHFVSTLSVFHSGGHDDGALFGEDADLDETGVPFGGYAQSKWVGEKLVMLAAERGIPAAIYRPGLVSGDSRSGVWNRADMMSTMTQSCIALGVVPELDIDVDIVPVDFVSKALVTLAVRRSEGQVATGEDAGTREDRGLRVYNLSNPQTMPYDELITLVQEAGIPLRSLPFEQWRQLLVDLALGLGSAGQDRAETSPYENPFLPLLDEVKAEQVFMPAFDLSHTLQGLAGTGVTCPPVGPELLLTYLGAISQSAR